MLWQHHVEGLDILRQINRDASMGCHLTTYERRTKLRNPYEMARATHPKKEVEDAIRHAEANGWKVAVGGSHAWGKLYCPYNDAECRCGE